VRALPYAAEAEAAPGGVGSGDDEVGDMAAVHVHRHDGGLGALAGPRDTGSGGREADDRLAVPGGRERERPGGPVAFDHEGAGRRGGGGQGDQQGDAAEGEGEGGDARTGSHDRRT
jgi:hypothetical protein